MYYNISFDLVAAVIILILIIRHCRNNLKVTPTYHLYFLMLLDAGAMTLLDIFSSVQLHFSDYYPVWSLYLVNILLILTQHALLPLYALFIIKTTEIPMDNIKIRLEVLAPYFITALLVLTTPFTKLIFYFENGAYKHGRLYIAVFVIMFLYIIQAILLPAQNKNKLSQRKMHVSILVGIIVFFAAIIQFLSGHLLVVNFGFALSMMLIHYIILNPMMIFDSTNAARKAVMLDNMKHYFKHGETFSLYTVHILNEDVLSDMYGESGMHEIMCSLRAYLSHYAYNGIVYRIEENAYAIRLNDTGEKMKALITEMNERLSGVWTLEDAKFYLRYYTGLLHCPEEVRTVTALSDYIVGLCGTPAEPGDMLSGSDLGQIEESLKILAAVKKAVLNKSFQVFYQPVYSVEKKRITAAEALIRLFDDEIGFVPPDKFIPIAEKEGYILRIGQFVFEEVCRFYAENRLQELGIEYIEVNLSAVQCMQYHLAEEFLEIMGKYGITPDCINLEITETSAIIANESLSSNIDVFSKNGVALSLDDYGTGYSNISYIYDIPFTYIKVDKCILWSATENQKAYVILKNTVEMAKRLKMQLIIEGVENKEHVQILRALNCEFFQGYYFSKAICGQDFVEYVNHFVLPEGCE